MKAVAVTFEVEGRVNGAASPDVLSGTLSMEQFANRFATAVKQLLLDDAAASGVECTINVRATARLHDEETGHGDA